MSEKIAAFMLPLLQGVLYGLVYTWLGIGMIGGWSAACTGSIWPSLISATLVISYWLPCWFKNY